MARNQWRMGCLFAAAMLLVAAGNAHATLIIDTTGVTPLGVDPFGEPNTATYGQTFTVVPSDPVLTGFTFFLDDSLDPDFVDFAAYVMAWTGTMATGPVLFSSGPISTTNNGGADGLEAISIATGGLALTPGQQYVAFFSASNFFDGVNGTASSRFTAADVYPGGAFVYSNNGNDFSQLTTSAWATIGDWRFRMTFEVIPEPATLSLLALGGLALLRRRRR